MNLNKDLVLREVGGEYMIVNPFSDIVDMTQVYSLNETAACSGNRWKARNLP